MTLRNFAVVIGFDEVGIESGVKASDYASRFEAEMLFRAISDWETRFFESEIRQEQGLKSEVFIATKLRNAGTRLAVNSRAAWVQGAGLSWSEFSGQVAETVWLVGHVLPVTTVRQMRTTVILETQIDRLSLGDHLVIFSNSPDGEGDVWHAENRSSFEVSDSERLSTGWMYLDRPEGCAQRAEAECTWMWKGSAGLSDVEGLVQRGKGFLDEGIELVTKAPFLALFE